jgi:hypothetical protein
VPAVKTRTKVLNISEVKGLILSHGITLSQYTKEISMTQYRRLIVILGVVTLLLLTIGAAAAKPNDKPKPPHGGAGHLPAGTGKPARLTWTPRRITQAVTAGQTIQLTATFTSSADIAQATLVIPGGLGKVMQADSATLANIKAGTPTTITFTVTMPAKAHSQGGVVLVRAGQRMIARPLPVLLTVANGHNTGQDEDDAAKPAKPAKPAKADKPDKPTHP